jgi:hypothetical protein
MIRVNGVDTDQFWIPDAEKAFLNPGVVDWARCLSEIATSKDKWLGSVIDDLLEYLVHSVLVAAHDERISTAKSAQAIEGEIYKYADLLKSEPKPSPAERQTRRLISKLSCSLSSSILRRQGSPVRGSPVPRTPFEKYHECSSTSMSWKIISNKPHFFKVHEID